MAFRICPGFEVVVRIHMNLIWLLINVDNKYYLELF